ncbi:MAG: hypothetical protein LBE74_02045 [Treponema sp.]|nr:hypothetical protein [Treponema sp.]
MQPRERNSRLNKFRRGRRKYKKVSPSKSVTVQDFPYLQIARIYEDADVSGVNNRGLQTFQVDIAAMERLVKRIPDRVITVAKRSWRR